MKAGARERRFDSSPSSVAPILRGGASFTSFRCAAHSALSEGSVQSRARDRRGTKKCVPRARKDGGVVFRRPTKRMALWRLAEGHRQLHVALNSYRDQPGGCERRKRREKMRKIEETLLLANDDGWRADSSGKVCVSSHRSTLALRPAQRERE
jgi:hypothetical protein